MVLLISFSEEEDPQTSEMAGRVLPRRPVCVRAPSCPEQLHVRGAQNRGGHRRLRDGPRQIRRPRYRPLQHAQGGNDAHDEAAGSASSLSLGAEGGILSSSSSFLIHIKGISSLAMFSRASRVTYRRLAEQEEMEKQHIVICFWTLR